MRILLGLQNQCGGYLILWEIQDSTRTTLLSTSVRLYRVLDAAGVQPVLDLYEGMWHVFQADLVPEAETAVEKSAAFIAKRLSAAKK